MTDGQKIRAFRRAHAQYEKRAAKAFYLALRMQIRSFLISKSEDPDTISPAPITAAFQRVWRTIGADYGGKVLDRIRREEGKGFVPDMQTKDAGIDPDFAPLIEEYLKLHGAHKIVGITETTRNWVREQLSQGHAQGLTYGQIAKNLLSDNINMSRAWLIARTESTGAMNFATFMAASKSAFLKEKNWIDSDDARVRPADKPTPFDHHHEDIGKQPLEKPFFVSGEELMFPGDTSLGASAGNICNCRCSFGLKTMRDQNGRMIRKPVGYKPPMIQQLELHSGVTGSLGDVVNGLMGIAAASFGNAVGDLISNLFNPNS